MHSTLTRRQGRLNRGIHYRVLREIHRSTPLAIILGPWTLRCSGGYHFINLRLHLDDATVHMALRLPRLAGGDTRFDGLLTSQTWHAWVWLIASDFRGTA